MGWRMRWWGTRFAQDRVPNPVGPWDWGGVTWSDGHTAQHYDLTRWAVETGLAGDPGGFALAYLWAQHWASQAFIWSDVPEFEVQHAIRYEKGAPALRGHRWGAEGRRTRPARQLERLPAAELAPVGHGRAHDRAPDRRSATSSRSAASGASMPSRPQRSGRRTDRAPAPGSSRTSPRTTCSPATTGSALEHRREVDEALRVAWPLGRSLPAWPDETSRNDLGTVQWSPWQHAAAVTTIRGAVEIAGVKLTAGQDADLHAIADATLERGTRLVTNGRYLQGAMALDRGLWQGAVLPDIWQGPTLTANFLAALHVAAAEDPAGGEPAGKRRAGRPANWPSAASARRCRRCASERQADCSAHGFAGEKIFGDQSWGNRPRWMVAPKGVGAPK